MKATNVILAVIGGAIAGATVGLLLAPQKGSETRDDIVKCIRKRKELCLKRRNKVEKLMDEIKDEIEDEIDNNF